MIEHSSAPLGPPNPRENKSGGTKLPRTGSGLFRFVTPGPYAGNDLLGREGMRDRRHAQPRAVDTLPLGDLATPSERAAYRCQVVRPRGARIGSYGARRFSR